MNFKIVKHLYFTVFLGLMLSQSASAALSLRLNNGENINLYGKSFALVVGVSDYDDWPDLPGVENDVKEVSSVLEEHGFTVMTVENPSRSDFDSAMRNFISKYGQDANNRLLFYFAGHGHSLKSRYGGQLGYIIPSNAALPDESIGEFKQKAISMLEMEIYAKQMESKHALFLFDSCFSGSLFALTRSVPPVISSKLAQPVRQFITAGSADQKVPDESIFRSQFVEGLKGAADINSDGYITGTELAQYLENKVTNYTRSAQTPQYGKIRDPYLDKGDFLFFRSSFLEKKYAPKVKPKPAIVEKVIENINPAKLELAYWDTVKTSDDIVLINEYIEQYPKGKFTKLAKLKVKSIERKNKESNDEEERLQNKYKLQRKKMNDLLSNQEKIVAMNKRLALQNAKSINSIAKGGSKVALKLSGPNNSVLIATHGQVSDDEDITNEEHSHLMSTLLKKITHQFVTDGTIINELKDHSVASGLLDDSDSGDKSKLLCQKHKSDYILAGLFDEDFESNPQVRAPPKMSYFIYDCLRNLKTKITYYPSEKKSDKFVHEESIAKEYRKFMRNYIRDEEI